MHNFYMLNSVAREMYIIPSIGKFPQNVTNIKINEALNRNQSEKGSLAQTLQLKVNTRVMLTVATDIEDRLVSRQLGTVMQITTDSNGNVTKIYVAFDDNKAGSRKMTKNRFGKCSSIGGN